MTKKNLIESLEYEIARCCKLSEGNKVKTTNLDVLYSGMVNGLTFALDLAKKLKVKEVKEKKQFDHTPDSMTPGYSFSKPFYEDDLV